MNNNTVKVIYTITLGIITVSYLKLVKQCISK